MSSEGRRIFDVATAILGEYLLMAGHPGWGTVLIVLAFL